MNATFHPTKVSENRAHVGQPILAGAAFQAASRVSPHTNGERGPYGATGVSPWSAELQQAIEEMKR